MKKDRMRTPAERKMRNYESRIFVSLVLMVSLPLLVLGGMMYVNYIREQTAKSDMMLEYAGENVSNQMENTLSAIRDYYLEATKGEDFAWLQSAEAVPYSDYTHLTAAQEVLQGSSYLREYIDGYEYINVRQGWVLDNYGTFAYHDTRNFSQFDEFVWQQADNGLSVFWLNRMGVDAPSAADLRQSRTVGLSGLMLVLKTTTSTFGLKSLLVVRLNTARLASVLSEWDEMGYEVALLDRENKLVLAANNALGEAAAAQSGNGIFKLNVYSGGGTDHYNVYLPKRSTNGFVYAVGYDVARATAGSNTFALLTLGVMAGMVLIIFACRRGSALLYRPLSELLSAVQPVMGLQQSGQNEFDYLVDGVSRLAADSRDMRDMLTMQKNQVRELFLLQLIRSEIMPGAIDHTLSELNIEPCACYRLAAVRCSLPAGVEKPATGPEYEALALTVCQQMPQTLKAEVFVQPIASHTIILLVLGAESEEALLHKLETVYAQAGEYLAAQFGCTMTMGVSQPFHTLTHMRTAFHEATETLRSKGLSGQSNGNTLAFYEQFAQGESIKNGYDVLLERELTEAVNGCNEQEAARLIDAFVGRIAEKGVTGYERSFYAQRIVIAMLAVASNAGLSMTQVYGERHETVFEELNRIYDADKLRGYLMEGVARPVMNVLRAYREDSSSDLVNRLVALIKEAKGDISLAECAERLNYHPSYIWKILKNERNATFTDLVNSEKLEMARQMLSETDCTVAEISQTLHYSNVQNFIRFFSREEGMTPGKYRKEHRAGEKALS